MAAQFSRTARSLARDTSMLAIITWIFALALLAAWMAWFVLGRVTVYEVSRSARLEVQQSAHPLAASVAGKLLTNRMVLGQEVHAGDVLASLDASREELRLAEEQTRLAAYAPRIASISREVASLRQALAEDRQAGEAAVRSAKFRAQEASAAVDFARDNERRLREESKVGGVAQVDALRAGAEAQKLLAARDALGADMVRIDSETRNRRSQQQAQIENLERTIVTLEGERATTESTITRLQQDIDQLLVRAPVDGVIGEVTPVRPGAFVTAGQKLATVVPRGGLVIVAEFPPAAVLGRIRPGQSARLRLDGFPWTEFGSVDATVRLVASEIREQTVRVELTPQPASNSRILLQHGLPGTVEISIEQASPAVLILRAMGQISPAAALAAAPTDKAKP